jgi:hypothetical protein
MDVNDLAAVDLDAVDIASVDRAVDVWLNKAPYQFAPLEFVRTQDTPIVSMATVLGPKLPAARATYAKYKSAKSSEQEMLFKECFAEGAANVLNIAAKLSDYIPGDITAPGASEKFEAYLKKVKTAPYFTTLLSRTVELVNRSKDFNALIDAVADTFVGIAEEDKKGVVNSLGKLAKLAASTSETRQTEDLFLQSTIYVGEEIELFIYNSHVEMESHESKGSTTSQSLFRIHTLKVRLLKGVFSRNSEKIRKATDRSVDEWGENNQSREGNLMSNLCLVGAQ